MPGFGPESGLFQLGRKRRQALAQVFREAGVGRAHRDMDFPAALDQAHRHPLRSGVQFESDIVRNLLGLGPCRLAWRPDRGLTTRFGALIFRGESGVRNGGA
jgi:hypothetical protein